MKLLLFDYGTGNLHSLRKALELQGATALVGTELCSADGLVLPGVGAFGAAADRLAAHRDAIRDAVAAGLPVLGICLGMQLLLDGSEEGAGRGLGLIDGRVRRLRTRRVPHMGWNRIAGDDPFVAPFPDDRFYFANSFVAAPADPAAAVIAWTTHEDERFPAVIRRGRVLGVQFHPEKSGDAGLRLLGAWVASLAATAGAGS